MSNAACAGAAPAPHDQTTAYRAVVSDLVSLIEHVHNSLQRIERMIDGETLESSTNIIVLDDVTPRYMKAAAALQACDVSLGTALRSLLDPDEGVPCSAELPSLLATGK